jgi:hypothetical protein
VNEMSDLNNSQEIVAITFNLESDYKQQRRKYIEEYGSIFKFEEILEERTNEDEVEDEFDEEEPKEKKKPIKFGRYFSFHEPDLLDFNILKNQAENPEKTKREKGYMVEIIKEETIYSGSQNILRKYVEYRVLSFKKNKTNGGF